MGSRHGWRNLSYLCLLGIVGLFIAGCVIQDPPAIVEIAKARKALDEAEKAGSLDRGSDRFVVLEKRYLQARGVFYACNDAEAIRLAQSIIADLGKRETVRTTEAAACPAPTARVTAAERAQVGEAVAMDASGSTTQSGQATYTWDFGDGTPPATFTFPRTTHPYTRPGNYTVRVTVNDQRCGTASATAPVTVVLRVVLQEKAGGKVLFDFDKAEVKPEARRQLGVVLQALREQPSLQVHIVGHTDSVGTDEYNDRLSQRRAEAVAAYLAQQGGIPRQNIRAEWRGEREPVASNATASGRAQNRRVEITLSPPARPGA
jgi:outer membrane protein OmpA-like peptidoglycan-associated protein